MYLHVARAHTLLARRKQKIDPVAVEEKGRTRDLSGSRSRLLYRRAWRRVVSETAGMRRALVTAPVTALSEGYV